jgi:hypothetical protein
MGVLGVPNTRPGWLCPAALNQARARRSFSLLVNRPTGPLPGENFSNAFQGRTFGAPAARDRARGLGMGLGRRPGQTAESGRNAPTGNPPHHPAAARLCAAAHGGGHRGTNPETLVALAKRRNRRACANRAILPARPLLKPSKIVVKAVCARRPTGNGQDDQVHVHAKAILLGSILHRSEARPGLGLGFRYVRPSFGPGLQGS